jgi:hypothetical protein
MKNIIKKYQSIQVYYLLIITLSLIFTISELEYSDDLFFSVFGIIFGAYMLFKTISEIKNSRIT